MAEDTDAYSTEELIILKGCTTDLPNVQPNVIRIFLSSTFSDTKLERNALMKETIPKLKQYCRDKYNCLFQAVDMRWGIPQEAATSHSATKLCLQEIAYCQKMSAGPNFVALIGNRYGSRSTFSEISDTEFKLILRHLPAANGNDHVDDKYPTAEESVSLLENWYKCDENARPPVHHLQPATAEMTELWRQAEPQLMRAIRTAITAAKVAGSIPHEEAAKYFESVTAAEINAGIAQAPEHNKKVLAFLREIDGINIESPTAAKFLDLNEDGTVNKECSELVGELKHYIKTRLTASNTIQMSTKWTDNGGLNREENADYLTEFCSTFELKIRKMIDDDVANSQNVSHLQMPAVVKEVLHHSKICEAKVKAIVPRADLMEQLRALVEAAKGHGPIFVTGPSGCGKTSIMASAAQQVRLWTHKDTIVLTRLLGTTPKSSSIYSVFESLCDQLRAVVPSIFTESLPTEFPKLAQLFWTSLESSASSGFRFAVVLDSIDQLQNDADKPFNLSWLPTRLPNNVCVLVSSIDFLYGIVDRARSFLELPPSNFVSVRGLSPDLAWKIITQWLDNEQRTLTDDQMKSVREAVSNQPIPLYVKLIFDVVKEWRSYADPRVLPMDVSAAINDLFVELETKHGEQEVKRTLGYVSLVEGGLSDLELEDILSLDDVYLSAVFQHHVPPIRRAPSVLWSRIRSDISEYVVEKEADDVPVIAWYHRQFIEKAGERYNTVSVLKDLITVTESYFMGEWGEGREKPFVYTDKQLKKVGLKEPNAVANRYVSAQPTCFDIPSRSFNLRKLHVLSDLWINHKMPRKVADYFLFDLEFMIGKLHYHSWSVIRSQLMKSLEHLRQEIGDCPEVYEYAYFLQTLVRSSLELTLRTSSIGPFVCGSLNKYKTIAPRISQFQSQAVSQRGISYNGMVPIRQFIPEADSACIMSVRTDDVKQMERVFLPRADVGVEALLCMTKSQLIGIDISNNEEVLSQKVNPGFGCVEMATIISAKNHDLFIICVTDEVCTVISALKGNTVAEFQVPDNRLSVCTKMKVCWKASSPRSSLNDLLLLTVGPKGLNLISLDKKCIVFSFMEVVHHANVDERGGKQFLSVHTNDAVIVFSISDSSSEVIKLSASPVSPRGSFVCSYIQGSNKDTCEIDAYVSRNHPSSTQCHVRTGQGSTLWRSFDTNLAVEEILGVRFPSQDGEFIGLCVPDGVFLYCISTLEPVLALRDPAHLGLVRFTPSGLMLRLVQEGATRAVTIECLQSVSQKNVRLSCKRLASMTVSGRMATHLVTDHSAFYLAAFGSAMKGWSIEKVLRQELKGQKDSKQMVAGTSKEENRALIVKLIPHPTQPLVLLVGNLNRSVSVYDVVTNTIQMTIMAANPSRPSEDKVEKWFWAGDGQFLAWYSEGKGIDLYGEDGKFVQTFPGDPLSVSNDGSVLNLATDFGQIIAQISSEHTILLYDKVTRKHHVYHYAPYSPSEHKMRFLTITNPTDHTAIVMFAKHASRNDAGLCVRNLSTEKTIQQREFNEIRELRYSKRCKAIFLIAVAKNSSKSGKDRWRQLWVLDESTLKVVATVAEEKHLWFMYQPEDSPLLVVRKCEREVMVFSVGHTPKTALSLVSEWTTSTGTSDHYPSYFCSVDHTLTVETPSSVALNRNKDGHRVGEVVMPADVKQISITSCGRFAIVLTKDDAVAFRIVDVCNEEQTSQFEKELLKPSSKYEPSYKLNSFDAEARVVWEDLIDRCKISSLESQSAAMKPQALAKHTKGAAEENLLLSNREKLEILTLTEISSDDWFAKLNVEQTTSKPSIPAVQKLSGDTGGTAAKKSAIPDAKNSKKINPDQQTISDRESSSTQLEESHFRKDSTDKSQDRKPSTTASAKTDTVAGSNLSENFGTKQQHSSPPKVKSSMPAEGKKSGFCNVL